MEILGVPVFDDDIYKLIVRFAFNIVFVGLVVMVNYFVHGKNKVYVFSIKSQMRYLRCVRHPRYSEGNQTQSRDRGNHKDNQGCQGSFVSISHNISYG